jgi:hypothetical protein
MSGRFRIGFPVTTLFTTTLTFFPHPTPPHPNPIPSHILYHKTTLETMRKYKGREWLTWVYVNERKRKSAESLPLSPFAQIVRNLWEKL